MIRKAIIILLTLAALGTVVLWLDSYRSRQSRPLTAADQCVFIPGNLQTGPPVVPGWQSCHATGLLGARGLRLVYPVDEYRVVVWTRDGALGLSYDSKHKTGRHIPGEHRDSCGFSLKRGMRVEFEEVEDLPEGEGLTVTPETVVHSMEFFDVTEVVVPLWALLVALGLYPTVAFIRGPLRRHRWRKKGLCIQCGYDLRGNVSGVCPECGSALRSDAREGNGGRDEQR